LRLDEKKESIIENNVNTSVSTVGVQFGVQHPLGDQDIYVAC